MKKFLLFFALIMASMFTMARPVGTYLFFADNGSHIFENDEIRVCVVVTGKNTLSVVIVNKTNKVLYIDKANSFLFDGEKTTCYYTNAAYTSGSLSSAGGSINLGGVANSLGIGGVAGGILSGTTLGGSNTASNSTTIFEQRIIGIAPQSAQTMSTINIFNSLSNKVITKGSYGRYGSKGKFIDPYTGKGTKFQLGDVKTYRPEFTPLCVKASFRYCMSENFTEENSQIVTAYNFIETAVVDNKKGVKKGGIPLPYCEPYKHKSSFAFISGGFTVMSSVAWWLTVYGGIFSAFDIRSQY